jgi:HAD superfamily hydrolase (TIGR01459 family)
MVKKTINGLKEIHENYDTFFIDLWGVMHNGLELYSEAIEVLQNLHKLGKRFVLMSNAPRPSKNVAKFLVKLKMDKIFTESIFTSGEASLKSLQKNIYGKYFFHLGPERDSSLFEGFENNKKSLREADFILCTGFFDGKLNSLDYYKNLLKNHIKLKMICTNPDLIVHRGLKKEYCAGTLAELFKNLGGEVIYFGKPYPEIYKFCIKKNERILIIGDNIRTDIKGANNMNIDSLFIINGIHEEEFLNQEYQNYDKILKDYKTTTKYYQKKLTW